MSLQETLILIGVLFAFTFVFVFATNFILKNKDNKKLVAGLADATQVLLGLVKVDDHSKYKVVKDIATNVVNTVEQIAKTKDEGMTSEQKLDMATELFYNTVSELGIKVDVSEDFVRHIIEGTVHILNNKIGRAHV